MISLDPARVRELASAPLLAVDPGTRYPAAALFDRGRLVAASRVPVPRALAKLERAERCRQIAKLIAAWALEKTGGPAPRALVFEWPQVYRATKSKGDPNDLIPLAAIGTAVAALLDVEQVVSPLPREWIGGIPKVETGDPWASPRGHVLRSRIGVLELSAIVPSHDALDAVGLGMWALGRLDRILLGAT
ncbi:MAG: hypothetical protein ACTHU0_00155 [Kofleriaceae bacterium]